MIDFKREIQTHLVDGVEHKIMIVTAFEQDKCYHNNDKDKFLQGRPMILINHLKEEFEEKPTLVHDIGYLNNIKYFNENFAHPNIFT